MGDGVWLIHFTGRFDKGTMTTEDKLTFQELGEVWDLDKVKGMWEQKVDPLLYLTSIEVDLKQTDRISGGTGEHG